MTAGYPYLVKDTSSLPAGLWERHAITTLDLTVPRVSIYCRGNLMAGGEESHEDAPWFVASFTRTVHDGQTRWFSSMEYPTAAGVAFWIGDVHTPLVGDEQADLSDPASLSDPAFRVRYALECGTCGLRDVRRADELNDALDKLWGVGVLEISLRGLRAILK